MQIEDKLSVTFAVSAALIIMYLETILGNPPSLDIAITLLSVGIGLQIIVWGRIKRDSTMSQNELTNIVKFGLFAFTAMMIASSVVPAVFVNAEVGTPLESISGLSVTDQILHGQVYAISEEVFFRGAFLGFILWQVGKDINLGRYFGIKVVIPKEWFASGLSALVFAVYHLAVYGFSQSTVYVLVAGVALGLVTAYSKRLSPAMLAHMGNNLVSVLLVTGGAFM